MMVPSRSPLRSATFGMTGIALSVAFLISPTYLQTRPLAPPRARRRGTRGWARRRAALAGKPPVSGNRDNRRAGSTGEHPLDDRQINRPWTTASPARPGTLTARHRRDIGAPQAISTVGPSTSSAVSDPNECSPAIEPLPTAGPALRRRAYCPWRPSRPTCPLSSGSHYERARVMLCAMEGSARWSIVACSG